MARRSIILSSRSLLALRGIVRIFLSLRLGAHKELMSHRALHHLSSLDVFFPFFFARGSLGSFSRLSLPATLRF